MKVIESFPHAVRDVENVWIPLRDGRRLAARAWLPADSGERPVPAVLEYLPYGKRDGTRARDEAMHRWFAGHGIAALRVDVRGTGESDGLLRDEYLDVEHADALDVIAWIAAQPWCTGAVGMMGKSWGGINALQVAALRPPALRAVITVCSTDDRHADDAHYKGGCLLTENLTWGTILLSVATQPADPALVPEWKEEWLSRLQRVPLAVETWLRHPTADDYWRRGSIRHDYSAIACPVFVVGGWLDGYTNAALRLLEGLKVPRRGLIGPWAHVYPHDGVPGPAVGFLQEALRWWEHWLCDRDTGLVREPVLRVFMQEGAGVQSFQDTRAGRWVAEPEWPPQDARSMRWSLGDGVLARERPAGAPVVARLRTPLSVGGAAGAWCPFGEDDDELPPDQREDDERSLLFDSPPLDSAMEILGRPVLDVDVASDRPRAQLVARLEDVGPDGTSRRVTYGLLDVRAATGEPTSVRLALDAIAHSFPAGHRVRLALSTSYWPLAWPSPELATLELRLGAASLELPLREPSDIDPGLRPFEPPEAAAKPSMTIVRAGSSHRARARDPGSGRVTFTAVRDRDAQGRIAVVRFDDIDLEVGDGMTQEHSIVEGDPLSARHEVRTESSARRGAWSVGTRIVTSLRATADEWLLDASLEARIGEDLVAERRWECRIPRAELDPRGATS